MKTAETDRQPRREKRPRQIDGAGELVRLDADQPDQRAPAGTADLPDDALRPNPAIGLVIGIDVDLDLGAQHPPPPDVFGQTIQAGQRVGRDRRPEPLDRIAVIVVMGRLDQDKLKQRGRGARHRSPAAPSRCAIRASPAYGRGLAAASVFPRRGRPAAA